jgi:glycosyltransferase involved in cell wall biosynthesis
MKKIAIYDRYLSTVGGGERYSCKIAQALSSVPGYSVDLVTDIYADAGSISRRLNLDLSKVELKVFPYISDDYIRGFTEKYHLFINATYLSALPSYGGKNIYVCYFPTPFDVDFSFVHRILLFFFRIPAVWILRFASKITRGFAGIEVKEGIYQPKRFMLGRGSWTTGRAVIEIDGKNQFSLGIKNPPTSSVTDMNVRVEAYPFHDDTRGGAADTKKFIYSTVLSKGEKKTVFIPGTGEGKNCYRIVVTSDTFTPSDSSGYSEDSRILGTAVYNEGSSSVLKKLLLKLIGYVPLFLVTYPKNLQFLESYHKIISISEYTAKWVKRLWGKESAILFPPVDTESFVSIENTAKEKIILSVGRFFPEHHNKKQYELVMTFIKMLNDYPLDMEGYRLYLAGGVADRAEHRKYVENIRKISQGYPVKIIENISFDGLASLFKKASIFWHAAGLGEDEDSHPEKFEHFGITTVEAMSAGCIPVVINKGGQKEIIKDGVDGFFFESLEELLKITIDIIRGKVDSGLIRRNAVINCQRFSNKRFEKDLLTIINEVLDGI